MDFDYSYSVSGDPTVSFIVGGVVYLISIIIFWRVFTKAGRPGWAAIIPIYNIYTLVKVGGKSGWYVLGFIVPILGLILSILLALGVAEKFGKSGAFGFIGLWLFSLIGYIILAFGSAQYIGEKPAK